MTTAKLKKPAGSYAPRLARFQALIDKVRALPPRDTHLWKVIDCPCFEDTETALETVLYNEQTARPRARR